jgi:opacity protein-like surface antigen
MKSFLLASTLLLPFAIAAPALAQDSPVTGPYVTASSGYAGTIVVRHHAARPQTSTHEGDAGYTGWGAFGWVDPQEVPSSAFNDNPGR